MERSQITYSFALLGSVINAVVEDKQRPVICPTDHWDALHLLIEKEQHYNGWFTKDSIKNAFEEISSWLELEKIEAWVASYVYAPQPKTVAIIMPGNLPLVGFHDFLCVLCSGNKALIKLSSEDARLLPALVEILLHFEPALGSRIEFVNGKLQGFEAVIATGSDNSMLHFKEYFAAYPSIMRGHRTSVAVLSGKETDQELFALGQDIFQYFGRGCRNVTHLLISADFELDRFFEAIVPYGDIIHHKKYGNNYDYNKAIHLMNQVPILDNNFVLLKESKDLNSPLGMLHYHRYQNQEQLNAFLSEHQSHIQCIVGEGFLAFGSAQCPTLNDYADEIDTMYFLGNFAACLS